MFGESVNATNSALDTAIGMMYPMMGIIAIVGVVFVIFSVLRVFNGDGFSMRRLRRLNLAKIIVPIIGMGITLMVGLMVIGQVRDALKEEGIYEFNSILTAEEVDTIYNGGYPDDNLLGATTVEDFDNDRIPDYNKQTDILDTNYEETYNYLDDMNISSDELGLDILGDI